MSDRVLTTIDGRVIARHLEIADTFWSRFVGLQFRSTLPAGHALLITRCPSIHTFCMRFAIDVAFLDDRGQVVEVARDLQPWRIKTPQSPASSVLETAAGHLQLSVGDIVQLSQNR